MGDVFNSKCPTRLVLDRIADKWTVLIVVQLQEGTFRFNELKRKIPGITQKMLTQTLKGLESDGIIRRELFPSVPPKVEYSLTNLGTSLTTVLTSIKDWAEGNIESILQAQENFNKAKAQVARGPYPYLIRDA